MSVWVHSRSARGSALLTIRLILRWSRDNVALPSFTKRVCSFTPPATRNSREDLSSAPTTRHFLLLSSMQKAIALDFCTLVERTPPVRGSSVTMVTVHGERRIASSVDLSPEAAREEARLASPGRGQTPF